MKNSVFLWVAVTAMVIGYALAVRGAAVSVKIAEAAVVWNPETGFARYGKGRCQMALAGFTNMIDKVTGRVPAVYVEGQEPADLVSVIYFGNTKAARAAGCDAQELRRGDWRIKSVPGKVFIFANSGMGLAYAAADFAERHCGYYYLTPEGDDPYDFNPALTIPVGDITVKPAIYNAKVYTAVGGTWNRWAINRRLSSTDEMEGQHRDSYEVRDFTGRTRTCHTSFCYLPPEKHFKDHPEYYSLIKGKRQYTPVGQLCMSNEEVKRLCLEQLLTFIAEDRRKYPDNYPLVYDFTQQDNMSFMCECPECKKIIDKYKRTSGDKNRTDNYWGGDAGLQLEFINWIADRVAEKYPDVLIRTFAYVSTETPPKPGTIKPSPNVCIWWCDLYGESEHLRPITAKPFNYKRGEQIREWLQLAKSVQVWDYMLYGGSHSGDFPEFAPDAIKADAKFFAENGLDDLFMESERSGIMPQPFYGLNYYLMSKLYTDPDEDVDALIKTYCRVYGKGAAKMYEALQFLRRIEIENPAQTPGEWHQRVLPWRTRANGEAFRALVKSAYDQEGPGAARARMARVLSSVSRDLVRTLGQIPSAAAELKTAKKDFADYSFEYAKTASMTDQERKKMLADIQTEVELFDLKFKNIPKEVEGVPEDEIKCADYHRFSGSPNGKRMDDPDSETGKAFVWKYGKPDAEHMGFPVSCGVYDGARKKNCAFKITAEMAGTDEQYHWIKLGKGWVGPQGMFWIPHDWHMSFRFADWHILCDGLPSDPNWYDVYLSAKFTGPAYVPGSTRPNGIWIDRLLLRRTQPPKENIVSPAKPGRADWMRGKYGLMVHWLFPSNRDIDRWTDAFNVDAFLKDFDKTGAEWLIFTAGQCRGAYCSPSETFTKFCGPGHVPKRDLLAEIACGVKARGKRFIVYAACDFVKDGCDDHSVQKGLCWDNSTEDRTEFERRWPLVLKEWAIRLEKNCDGWWLDGLGVQYPNGVNWKLWCEACRAGNPAAAIAFNSGANNFSAYGPCDYTAGEASALKFALPDLDTAPPAAAVRHHLFPIDGYWGGFWTWPTASWAGVQHLMPTRPELFDKAAMDARLEKRDFPDPIYDVATLGAYLRKARETGSAATINIGISPEGRLNPKSIELIRAAR